MQCKAAGCDVPDACIIVGLDEEVVCMPAHEDIMRQKSSLLIGVQSTMMRGIRTCPPSSPWWTGAQRASKGMRE